MVPPRGSVNPMTPPSPYADLMVQRRPLQMKPTIRPNLKFSYAHDKRDNFLSMYQMGPLRVSVNPMTPPSPCADLMAQRRPLQTKHAFSTKLEVHLYTG